jgi:NADPH-dependent 2,4-dienoyl-CoA reductase/sulfur reductase-like enzyme
MTLSSSDHVVVVGGGFAGWRFVEALRREGFEGQITLIGEERFAPYDRPPLSKNVLVGKWEAEKTTLATPEKIEESGADVRFGQGATALDVATSTVHLADGSTVQGTFVVIATGTRARRLGYSADDLIHTLRGRDDVETLNDALGRAGEASAVAVIGGGFIGAEVATALHTRGFVPVVLEVAERPLLGVLGPDVARWLERLPKDVGIELRTSQRISDVLARGDRFEIRFENGEELVVPTVVVGAGAVVNDEWLAQSGLEVDNGVVVDENLLAAENVGAIGDVARFAWKSALGTERVRIEHWQVANDHAAHLAHFLVTGNSLAHTLVPYFWSDQYGKKIQVLGHPSPHDDVRVVSGSVDEGKWVALYSREGSVSGVVTLANPRGLMLSKVLLDQRTSIEDALSSAPWSP